MKEIEYEIIQERLSKKLIKGATAKRQPYNEGILAAKSIIKELYEYWRKRENEIKARETVFTKTDS